MPCKSCAGGRRLAGGVVFAASCASVLAVCGLPRAGVDRARGAVFAGPRGGCGHRLASGCRPGRLQAPEAGPPPHARAHGDALPGPDSCGNAHAADAGSPASTPQPSTAPQIEDAGLIRAEQFRHGRGEGSISLSAGSIRNSTACADADLRAAVTTANLPFAVELNSDEPQVLILHTHATESYQTWPDLLYDRSATARTRNTALNMCAVGARMAQVLNAAGIHTLHDETLYDSPSYTESYDRSRATAQEYLRQYPSIKVVLDVHRDAIEDSDGTRVKPVCRSTARERRRSWSLPGAATAAPSACLTGGSICALPPNGRKPWRVPTRA